MYNRYIRNDNGTYTHICEEEDGPQAHNQPRPEPASPPPSFQSGKGRSGDGLTGFLRHVLDQFHLDSIDTGDLILLGLLFFLSKEDADEELLMALGLLLIL